MFKSRVILVTLCLVVVAESRLYEELFLKPALDSANMAEQASLGGTQKISQEFDQEWNTTKVAEGAGVGMASEAANISNVGELL